MLPVQEILDSSQIADVHARLAAIPYQDGKLTAGANALAVKQNSQADLDSELTLRLQEHIQQLLLKNFLFRIYTRPAKWSRMLFSRYGPEEHYGRHYDNWTQRATDGERMRSDISFTLFLSEPNTYEGGELVLERNEGPLTVKMPAGGIFLYPTGVIHQVVPVTAGERHVCVGWVQSQVRSEERRSLLFDLDLVLANIPKGEPRLTLDKSIGTLLRMWADV